MNDLQGNSSRPSLRVSFSRRMLQLTVLLAATAFITYQDVKPSKFVAMFSTTKEKKQSKKTRGVNDALLHLRSQKRRSGPVRTRTSGVLRTKTGDDYEREKGNVIYGDKNDSLSGNNDHELDNTTDAAAANKVDDGNSTSGEDPTVDDDSLVDTTKENTPTSDDEAGEKETLSAVTSMPAMTPDKHWRPNIKELEQQFYDEHYQSLKDMEISNALLWRRNHPDPLFHLFLEQFDYQHEPTSRKDIMPIDEKQFLYFWHLCPAVKRFNEYRQSGNKKRLPHVLFFDFSFDFGGLSEAISNKTDEESFAKGHKVFGNLGQGNCSKDDIFSYLDHPDTLAAITTQSHIFDHPKAHSLPLGMYTEKHVKSAMDVFSNELDGSGNRTQLLMLNARGWSWRQTIMDRVNLTFAQQYSMPLTNTYGAYMTEYYKEMANSKFILSPYGNGLDCYRHWEALFMGCIPVLEHLNRTDGWFHVFDDLPVAWIDSFDNLTPQWLEEEYTHILSRYNEYNWDKLTKQWWIGNVKGYLQ